MSYFPLVLAYLGPETMLPMTSVLAGAAGVIMMFGRSSVRWIATTVRRFTSPKPIVPIRRIGSGPVGTTQTRV